MDSENLQTALTPGYARWRDEFGRQEYKALGVYSEFDSAAREVSRHARNDGIVAFHVIDANAMLNDAAMPVSVEINVDAFANLF